MSSGTKYNSVGNYDMSLGIRYKSVSQYNMSIRYQGKLCGRFLPIEIFFHF